MQAKLFIGSSSEGKKIAYAIQENLDQDAEITVWDQGIFNLSSNYLFDLIEASKKFDYAILIYTPDDNAKIRNQNVLIPRDNVIFETGLFIGSIGRERTYFVAPRGVEKISHIK